MIQFFAKKNREVWKSRIDLNRWLLKKEGDHIYTHVFNVVKNRFLTKLKTTRAYMFVWKRRSKSAIWALLLRIGEHSKKHLCALLLRFWPFSYVCERAKIELRMSSNFELKKAICALLLMIGEHSKKHLCALLLRFWPFSYVCERAKIELRMSSNFKAKRLKNWDYAPCCLESWVVFSTGWGVEFPENPGGRGV